MLEQFFDKMIPDIETDLGGWRQFSCVEGKFIRAFAGAAFERTCFRRVALF
jgi:hypothetical protein